MAESKKKTPSKKVPAAKEEKAAVVEAEPVKEEKAPETIAEQPAPGEEKKEEVAPEKKAEEDSDFADEAKPVSAPVPEKPAEEAKPAEPSINLHAEGAAEAKPADAKAPVSYTYDDPLLQGVEDSRSVFYKLYKKQNITKWIITAVSLVMILLGWLIPTLITGLDQNVGFYITLGVLVVAVALLGIYSYVFKKQLEKAMKVYFLDYYSKTNAYVFDSSVENLSGTVDDKLDEKVFKDSNLYKDVVKVGSRECLHFTRKGEAMLMADCAGQVKGQKSLQTIFVGKILTTPNAWQGGDVIIYFKGNSRALPPTNLSGYEVYEDTKTMVIYGDKDTRKLLSHPVRQALAAISTNDTFVDLAISIRNGTTYYLMGYEDNLMVLPLDKPFNPAPTSEFKADMTLIFALVDAFKEKPQD
jgi:hypothetical protein